MAGYSFALSILTQTIYRIIQPLSIKTIVKKQLSWKRPAWWKRLAVRKTFAQKYGWETSWCSEMVCRKRV